jgi:hypothetical protein
VTKVAAPERIAVGRTATGRRPLPRNVGPTRADGACTGSSPGERASGWYLRNRSPAIKITKQDVSPFTDRWEIVYSYRRAELETALPLSRSGFRCAFSCGVCSPVGAGTLIHSRISSATFRSFAEVTVQLTFVCQDGSLLRGAYDKRVRVLVVIDRFGHEQFPNRVAVLSDRNEGGFLLVVYHRSRHKQQAPLDREGCCNAAAGC